ncbi:extracellular solute-binding protein [Paenibacillus sp. CC-CFT747]|nr:extracellular solute-binding protein [Paenibacillus sp. CC-CFT747]
MRRILERFEKQHPFVRVELILLPVEGYTPTLIRLIEQGRGPDVFMMSDTHVRDWIDSGRTDYVSGYVPGHLSPDGTSYPPVFEIFAHGDRTLAAPFIFSPVMICYNRALFRECGLAEDTRLETWEELLHAAKQCTRDLNDDGIIEQYGFCFSSSPNRWPVFLLQNGGQFMADDRSRSALSRKENIEALEFCTSLMYKHHVSPIYSHGSSHLAESLFKKERVAMILTTYYFMNEFREHSIEWDVLPVTKRSREATLLLGGGLAVNSRSEHGKAARKLVDYMTSVEAQTLLKQYGCTIPALRSVAEDDSLLDPAIHPEHYQRFLEVLPYARPLHSLQLRQREILLLADELTLLWASMESPREACQRIEVKLNRLLKDQPPGNDSKGLSQ